MKKKDTLAPSAPIVPVARGSKEGGGPRQYERPEARPGGVDPTKVRDQHVLAQGPEGRVDGSQVSGEIIALSKQRLVDESLDQLRCRGALGSRASSKGSPLLITEIDIGSTHTPRHTSRAGSGSSPRDSRDESLNLGELGLHRLDPLRNAIELASAIEG